MTHSTPCHTSVSQLITHQKSLRQCHSCDAVIGPVVTGEPVVSPVLLVGQAPGEKEGSMGKPFAWTAGKTLFKWFQGIGLNETQFRQSVYMSAVCRCFPGKKAKGGDRVPSAIEIETCTEWLTKEIDLLQPQLILPVGKLAIAQFIAIQKLTPIIGRIHPIKFHYGSGDLIPLPHPSGASTWHRTDPGKGLLQQALSLIEQHQAWKILRK